jgi:uncharacterized protein YceK
VLIALVAGCGSVFSRLGPDHSPELYPATNTMLEAAGDCWCWYFLACPIFLLTLPVDVALDTLLLPVDAVRVRNRDAPENRAESSGPAGVTEAS